MLSVVYLIYVNVLAEGGQERESKKLKKWDNSDQWKR